MELKTHLAINTDLSGVVVSLGPGSATVELVLTGEMAVDARGLVHGGFMFSAGDFAAMAAVNDPNVVLASAEVRFIKPARVGDRLTFEARVTESKGRRRSVEVRAADGGGTDVFSGTFGCFVPERHVLADR